MKDKDSSLEIKELSAIIVRNCQKEYFIKKKENHIIFVFIYGKWGWEIFIRNDLWYHPIFGKKIMEALDDLDEDWIKKEICTYPDYCWITFTKEIGFKLGRIIFDILDVEKKSIKNFKNREIGTNGKKLEKEPA